MTRHRTLLTSALLSLSGALFLPAAAPAKIAELGLLAAGVQGSCPQNCNSVTRTTGYQAKVGPDRMLYRAPVDGRIVAWTAALGNPGPKQTAFFNERYGGMSQAAVIVLRPGKKLRHRVVAKAPLQTLNDYFGQVVQFPLVKTLRIRKGQYIGITVPTWAPLLKIGLGTDSSWRSSRTAGRCLDFATQTAMLGSRTTSSFRCLYRGVRLTYSATFVSDPAPPAS
ncbi:MAG: hypothetical protein ACRDKY_04470 [Solirubrobacteraceae bacterium]